MENLTWRMMALALKKKKDEEAKQGREPGELDQAGVQVKKEPGEDVSPTAENNEVEVEEERGRRIDKGKTKVSVVGFDGENQDSTEDDE
jgi:GATA-binding protein